MEKIAPTSVCNTFLYSHMKYSSKVLIILIHLFQVPTFITLHASSNFNKSFSMLRGDVVGA